MKRSKPSGLRNLGPKSDAMLAAIGIETIEDLRNRGSVDAYAALVEAGRDVSLNLLWAMEGALTNRDWRDVAREDRLRLLLELEEACRKEKT
jgi:DNA transformation protein